MNFFKIKKSAEADQNQSAVQNEQSTSRRVIAGAALAGVALTGATALGLSRSQEGDNAAPAQENVPAQTVVPGTVLEAKPTPTVEPGPVDSVAPTVPEVTPAPETSLTQNHTQEHVSDAKKPEMPPGIITSEDPITDDGAGPEMPPGIITTEDPTVDDYPTGSPSPTPSPEVPEATPTDSGMMPRG